MTDEERARVGTKLQRLRRGQGLKQEDIAKKAGMAIGTVQHIEYNKHKVTVEKIEKYAAVFGTTAEQLRSPEPRGAIPTESTVEIIEIIDGLNEFVFRLANDQELSRPPANWTPHQWAYLRGLASAQILRYRDRLRREWS